MNHLKYPNRLTPKTRLFLPRCIRYGTFVGKLGDPEAFLLEIRWEVSDGKSLVIRNGRLARGWVPLVDESLWECPLRPPCNLTASSEPITVKGFRGGPSSAVARRKIHGTGVLPIVFAYGMAAEPRLDTHIIYHWAGGNHLSSERVPPQQLDGALLLGG